MTRYTRCNFMWWNLSVTCDRSVVFSGTPVSSTKKTDSHDIAEYYYIGKTHGTTTKTPNKFSEYLVPIYKFIHRNFLIIGGSASHVSCYCLLYFYILEVRWILMETLSSTFVVPFPQYEPRSWRGILDTTLCDEAYQWLATGQWFPPLKKPTATI
jgi:hypothetical protein